MGLVRRSNATAAAAVARETAGAAQPSDGYGAVLRLLMAGFVAAAVLSNRPARVVTVLLHAAALVLTLRVAHFPAWTAWRLRWGRSDSRRSTAEFIRLW
jgi:hypothetical protein